jgi:acyl-coenzyme A thioesterase PaaI-like protein
MPRLVNKDDLLLLPNDENHNCFGCSPQNEYGLKMEFYSNAQKDAVLSWLTVPDHVCGWGNLVHGGIISTILDEAMGWAAVVILQKLILTKTMTVDFLKFVFTGQEIIAQGHVENVVSDREVEIRSVILDGNGEVCAKASSIVSLFNLDVVRKMGFLRIN